MADENGAASTPGRLMGRALTGFERLNAFSDGIFSITITLLLLELRLPDGDADLASTLWGLQRPLVTLAFTFAILGIYWVGHHGLFQAIKRPDRTLLWLNLMFLFFVGLIPFSAQVLVRHPDEPLALAVYAGNLILVGAALDLVWRYASHKRRLIDESLPDHFVWMVHARVQLGPILYAVAIALAFLVSVTAARVILIGTPLLYIVPWFFDWLEEWHLRAHARKG